MIVKAGLYLILPFLFAKIFHYPFACKRVMRKPLDLSRIFYKSCVNNLNW